MAARKSPAEGRKGDKLVRDALMVALKREADGANGKRTRKLQVMAEKLVDKACEGDVAAIKEVADRVDGRPAQAVEMTGELGFARIERQVVDPLPAANDDRRGAPARANGHT